MKNIKYCSYYRIYTTFSCRLGLVPVAIFTLHFGKIKEDFCEHFRRIKSFFILTYTDLVKVETHLEGDIEAGSVLRVQTAVRDLQKFLQALPAPHHVVPVHSTHHGGKKAVGDLQKILQALPAPHHVVPVHSTVRTHHGGKKAVGDLQKLLQTLPAPHHVVPVHSTVRTHHGGKKAVGDLQKLLQALPAPHHVEPVHSTHHGGKKAVGDLKKLLPGTSGPVPRGSCTQYTPWRKESGGRSLETSPRHFRPRTTWFLYTVHTMEERKRWEISRNFSRHFRPRTTWFLCTVRYLHTMEERIPWEPTGMSFSC
jgi:hypothetical protein